MLLSVIAGCKEDSLAYTLWNIIRTGFKRGVVTVVCVLCAFGYDVE